MARIFITGSSSGLGLLAGQQLAARGHRVVLHARNSSKVAGTRAALPELEDVVTGDLEVMQEMRSVAEAANALGRFDSVIHNAGVGDRSADRLSVDGLPVVFAVNVLSAYVLTALMEQPDRLIYLSSGMHVGARPSRLQAFFQDGRWNGPVSYPQTKFMITTLAFAVSRQWPEVRANAVNPGWVPTRMGGPSAPDNLEEGAQTQTWLAEGREPGALLTGRYFRSREIVKPDHATHDTQVQDELLMICKRISGVSLTQT